jgi:YfiH family protein
VAANRARLAAAIGLDANRVVWMNQVHGDHVEVVGEPSESAVDDTDALVTATPRLALAVVTADCVPVLMADARAGVVAAVHAGRVGAQRGVVARALEAMLSVGARTEDISVLLGPAVSGRNYEVPAAMADEVGAALPGSRTTTSAGTPGLDLRAGLACQLSDLGVKAIDIDPRCTVDDPSLFSHRRDAPTGRLASLVWME